MAKEGKYKNFSEIASRDSKGYKIGSVESYSAKNGKKKNWVAKYFYRTLEDEATLDENRKVRERYKNYLFDCVVDAYATRLLHSIDSNSPKGKFVNDLGYVSRLYAFDGFEVNNNVIKSSNLKEKLNSGGDIKSSNALLKSVVQRIVMDDWDNKLSNYDGNGYSFDLGYAFTNIAEKKACNKNDDTQCSKKWKDNEILDIVSGKSKDGQFVSVGNALAETIADFGERTNEFYYNWYKENNPAGYEKNCNLKRNVGAHFNEQLQYLVDNYVGVSSKSEALLAVFSDVIDEFKANKGRAYGKVKVNIDDAMGNRKLKHTCSNFLDECDSHFSERLRYFRGVVDTIQYNNKNEPDDRGGSAVQSRYADMVMRQRDGSLSSHSVF